MQPQLIGYSVARGESVHAWTIKELPLPVTTEAYMVTQHSWWGLVLHVWNVSFMRSGWLHNIEICHLFLEMIYWLFMHEYTLFFGTWLVISHQVDKHYIYPNIQL